MILDFSTDRESEIRAENRIPQESSPEPQLRRSTREKGVSQTTMVWNKAIVHEVRKQSTSFEEAATCPDSTTWSEAMEMEMRSLKDNDI